MENMAVVEASSPVLYDGTESRRLSEVYAPCFTLVLQLRSAVEFGDADVLRRRIKQMLDRAERDALRVGISPGDVDLAKFALIAFIDETILSSDWSEKDRWLAKPLQLELYNRYDAGEEFFVKLDQIRAQAASRLDVLELYYLCMTLGFKGRYQIHDQERLRLLIEEVQAELRRLPGMAAPHLAPHGKARDQIATEVKSKLPVWVIVAFAVVLAIAVYFGMQLYISSAAGDAANTIDQIPRTQVVQ